MLIFAEFIVKMLAEAKSLLITGGTGSFGKNL